MVIRSLAWFDDAEAEPDPEPLTNRSWPAVKATISAPRASLTSQFLSSVEKGMAHFQSQTLIRSSKRGGAEVAEQLAEFLAVSLILSWGQATRRQPPTENLSASLRCLSG